MESKRVALLGLSETCILRGELPPQLAWFPWDVSPWGVLPASSEEYWSQRPSSLRRSLGQARRRLERAGVVYDRPASDDSRVLAAEYARLRKLRWGYGSLIPEQAQFLVALERGLSTEEMVVHRLSIDGRAIVVDFWFHVGGVASAWRQARDLDKQWRGSGTLLRAHAIEHAIARGEREIDLLRGGEPYKYEWVDQQRQLGQIQDVSGWREAPGHCQVRPQLPSETRASEGGAGQGQVLLNRADDGGYRSPPPSKRQVEGGREGVSCSGGTPLPGGEGEAVGETVTAALLFPTALASRLGPMLLPIWVKSTFGILRGERDATGGIGEEHQHRTRAERPREEL